MVDACIPPKPLPRPAAKPLLRPAPFRPLNALLPSYEPGPAFARSGEGLVGMDYLYAWRCSKRSHIS